MMPPRTVLFIHSGRDWVRGSERVLLDLATNLPPARYRAVVWCDSEVLRAASREAGLEVVERAFPPPTQQPWWRAPAASRRDALSVIRERDAALLHVNTLDCLPWALRAARTARIPVIAHLHSPSPPDERIWSGLHQATVTVGVSRFSISWAEADGLGPAATRLIYNAVFPARLEAGDATGLRAQLGIPAESFVAASVGSLIPLKDVGTVIEGVARAGRAGSEIHLLIVGSGEERGRLEAHAAEAGIADRVHLLGERNDVGAILRDAADVLISAAREETFGLNMIEAGYFGLPCLVSDIPPHREILGEAGDQLFVAGDAEDLARKLRGLQDASVLRTERGPAAGQRIRERFSPDRFVHAFTSLYDELVALPSRRLGWLSGFRFPRCYWRFGWARLGRVRRPLTGSRDE